MKFLITILALAIMSASAFAQSPVEKSFQKLENKINNNIPAEYRATLMKSVNDLRYSVATFACGSSSSVGYICKGYVKGYEYTYGVGEISATRVQAEESARKDCAVRSPINRESCMTWPMKFECEPYRW